jgi:hypothetical protein
MIRVVLDSNVYILALLFGGTPRAVVELAQLREFELFASEPLIDEIEEVLKAKFHWSEPWFVGRPPPHGAPRPSSKQKSSSKTAPIPTITESSNAPSLQG